jgi:hypothetical protein
MEKMEYSFEVDDLTTMAILKNNQIKLVTERHENYAGSQRQVANQIMYACIAA